MSKAPLPRNSRPEDWQGQPTPMYVVWETTMKCDHACAHCGSRAVKPRENELNTKELLEVADALIRLNSREVTLIGGEAYLRDDVYELIEYLTAANVRVTMQSGGRGINRERAQSLKDAGLHSLGISVDGTALVHDRLRGSLGSHRAAIQALEYARDVGIATSSNAQVNRLNKDVLPELIEEIKNAGARVWRAQLTVPMGRAADRPDWILEPYMLLEIFDRLAVIQNELFAEADAKGIERRKYFHLALGNNLGYYGPHEELLRSDPSRPAYWQGCQAGRYTLGIESDGNVKGCPSLPTAPYIGGNVRDMSVEDIWHNTPELNFTRTSRVDELWGHCKTCYYADICQGGCSFTSHCTLGKRGNNPFCYHRADKLQKIGRRERLVQTVKPEGLPYDFGRFEIIEEEIPS